MIKNLIISATVSAILAVAGLAQGTAVPEAKQKVADAATKAKDQTATTAKTAKTAGGKHTPMLAPGVTEADITNSQAKGLVWVNTGTGVYHKGGEYYGKTKAGKFMTEDEAKKAGHHAAKLGAMAKHKK